MVTMQPQFLPIAICHHLPQRRLLLTGAPSTYWSPGPCSQWGTSAPNSINSINLCVFSYFYFFILALVTQFCIYFNARNQSTVYYNCPEGWGISNFLSVIVLLQAIHSNHSHGWCWNIHSVNAVNDDGSLKFCNAPVHVVAMFKCLFLIKIKD